MQSTHGLMRMNVNECLVCKGRGKGGGREGGREGRERGGGSENCTSICIHSV